METPTPTAAGTVPATQTPAPAAPTPVAAPVSTTPEKLSAREIVAGLNSEQRRLLVTGKYDQIAQAASAEAAPTPTPVAATITTEPAAPAVEPIVPEATTPAVEPAATPAADDNDDSDGASPGADDAGVGKSKRFRFTDEEDQAVALFARKNGLSLIEAARRMSPVQPAATTATPTAQAQPAAAPAIDPEVAEYDSQIADAKKRATELVTAREKASEDLDQAKVIELSDQIADAKAEARILENEKKGHIRNRDQQAQQSYATQVNAARDRAYGEFEVFKNPESMEAMALDAYAQRALKDPARRAEFASDPNWPEKLAREFAQKQGIKPKGQVVGNTPAVAPAAVTPKPPTTLTKAQPKQVPSTQPSGAKLLTGANGQPSSAPSAMTGDDLKQAIRTASPADRRAMVRHLSTLTPVQTRR